MKKHPPISVTTIKGHLHAKKRRNTRSTKRKKKSPFYLYNVAQTPHLITDNDKNSNTIPLLGTLKSQQPAKTIPMQTTTKEQAHQQNTTTNIIEKDITLSTDNHMRTHHVYASCQPITGKTYTN